MDILDGVTKHLVDLDEELLASAKDILGTDTLKDTVNTAFREIVSLEMRRRHLERLRTMIGLDLDNPDVMKGAWRQ
jgi:Arc/MetJ family transcription regulator